MKAFSMTKILIKQTDLILKSLSMKQKRKSLRKDQSKDWTERVVSFETYERDI